MIPQRGTGTFITSLIDYMPQQRLVHKYDNEIFANEIAILPYYVANLNIEFTFKQKMGLYREFQNLCFVDTLDNTQALGYQHESDDMFGLTFENSQRIKRQNEMKIAVVIGNPPYHANQLTRMRTTIIPRSYINEFRAQLSTKHSTENRGV